MSQDERIGSYLRTYTGRRFYPRDVRIEEIDIEDIAHALSLLCRYAGHCSEFYSVAQHSVLVAEHAPPALRRQALLHDAPEAYLADLPRPIKDLLLDYRVLENDVLAAVFARFGVAGPIDPAVKAIDNRILNDEAARLLGVPLGAWSNYGEPLGCVIEPWKPAEAEGRFLAAFAAYSNPPLAVSASPR